MIIFANNLMIIVPAILIVQTLLDAVFFYKCTQEIQEKKIDAALSDYSWFVTKLNVFTIASAHVDKVLIGFFLGPEQLAAYTIGTLLPAQSINAVKAGVSVFLPKFASDDNRMTWKKLLFTIVCSVIIFSIIIAVLPFFINVLFNEYSSTIGYGVMFSFIMLILPVNALMGFYFRAKKERDKLSRAVVFSRAISLLLSVPFLLFFGIYGLIGIRIFGELIFFIIAVKSIVRDKSIFEKGF